jgi:hypothetical protein
VEPPVEEETLPVGEETLPVEAEAFPEEEEAEEALLAEDHPVHHPAYRPVEDHQQLEVKD